MFAFNTLPRVILISVNRLISRELKTTQDSKRKIPSNTMDAFRFWKYLETPLKLTGTILHTYLRIDFGPHHYTTDKMEIKETPACPVEEDSKTAIKESSKPKNGRSKFVFDVDTFDGWNDDTPESIPDVKDSIKNKPRSNRPMCWWNQGFKGHKPSVAFLAFLMVVTIPGVLGQCIGDSVVCLSLAENRPDWFNERPECLDVRCLNLSNGRPDLVQLFPNLEEMYVNDMGNITIPCDVLKNLSNLHKIDLHVKNIPTVVCNTSCVLSEVTVAVLHNSTAINCNLTEWMPKLISVSFENDQAPTSVPPGIISESVTTTAANMVNQEKDAGFSVSFKNDQAPTSVPTEITSEGIFTTPGNMVYQEKDTGIGVGVVIGVFALGVVVGIVVGIVVVILLHQNKIIKIVCKKSSTPVQEVLYTCASGVKMSDQCESESVV